MLPLLTFVLVDCILHR